MDQQLSPETTVYVCAHWPDGDGVGVGVGGPPSTQSTCARETSAHQQRVIARADVMDDARARGLVF
jgi:hypothetical protein